MNYPWAITHLIKRRMILCKFIRSYSQSYTNQKSANLIRKEFVDYFSKDLNHSIIRSSPVFPIADQSLAFVNAGMNQVCSNHKKLICIKKLDNKYVFYLILLSLV